MATVFCKKENVRGIKPERVGYVGELKDNLRNGYGIYTYPNKFYSYEGEWKNGLKHGFGRFNMRDGSYYEGQFVNGEIEGTGKRFWASSGNNFEGHFSRGEINGKGVMKYGDGSEYEGSWEDNKREGEGVLKESNGAIYKGSFHLHKRHGEGMQIYSTGDEYNGGWVNNKKHGHGVMKYQDGSEYVGQWWMDRMNGEGSLTHTSGITYEGLWSSGRPSLEPVKLSIVGNDVIMLEQSDVIFSIEIHCQTSVEDKTTTESGRQLRVSAAIRVPDQVSTTMSRSSATSDMSTPAVSIYDSRRQTPFGFDVEPYPIKTFAPDETSPRFEDIQEASCESLNRSPEPNPIAAVDNSESVKCYNEEVASELNNQQSIQDSVSPQITPESKSPQLVLPVNKLITPDNKSQQNLVVSPVEGSANGGQPDVLLIHQTVNGLCTFSNLMLPSQPATSVHTSVCLSPESTDGQKAVRNRKSGEPSSTKLVDRERKKTENIESTKSDRESASGRKKKTNKIAKQDIKSEDPTQEKFCKPGDYVVIVEDVTENPFLDIRLSPVFIHVIVSAPSTKRSRSRNEKK